MTTAKAITRQDIMPTADYVAVRKEKRKEAVQLKKDRRLEVGPHVTFYFESYDTMWHQIHEMLYIEKGGEEQIADELTAYNPLIPKGRELIATMMFEIDDPVRRKNVLARLGGVEKSVTITIGNHIVTAKAEEDVDRTTADGKTSSVHFLHFPFTDEQAEAFKSAQDQVVLAIGKEGYQHMAVMPAAIRDALKTDLD